MPAFTESSQQLLLQTTNILLNMDEVIEPFYRATKGLYKDDIRGIFLRDSVYDLSRGNTTVYYRVPAVHQHNCLEMPIQSVLDPRYGTGVGVIEDNVGNTLITSGQLRTRSLTDRPDKYMMVKHTVMGYLQEYLADEYHWSPAHSPLMKDRFVSDTDTMHEVDLYDVLADVIELADTVMSRHEQSMMTLSLHSGLMRILVGVDHRIYEYTLLQEFVDQEKRTREYEQ